MISITKERFAPPEIVSSPEQEEKFRFVSDIDDLLADAWSDWIGILNQHFKTALTPEEVSPYGYVQNVPVWLERAEELKELMESLRQDPQFVSGHRPIEGAAETLYALTEIGSLECYLTSRPTAVYQATIDWLDKYLFPKAPVLCRPTWIDFSKAHQCKKEYIEKSGVDLVLEDDIWFAENLSVQTIIIERPHNKQVVPKGGHIIKVPHWYNVPTLAIRIKEERLKKK